MSSLDPAPKPKPIAAFDVDGTLTWTDSFMLFMRFVSGRWGFIVTLVKLLPVFGAYVLGLRNRDETKNRLMIAFLRGRSYPSYQEYCDDFADVAYPIIARRDALARLNAHVDARDEVVLVSASLEDYLKPWAKSLNIETVLATRVEVVNNKLTGRMVGPNCRCEQKVNRLREHFGDAHIVAAYGDSRGDHEMLAASENPGMLVFKEAPANRHAILWDLYFGDLLERTVRGRAR
jgi:phosphatidylglycerophosphatase C